jgi:hypothetical protein
LEHRRRCGWLRTGSEDQTEERIVWAAGGLTCSRCPKSLLNASSLNWIETFGAWQRLGRPAGFRMRAKDMDAMVILSEEMRKRRHELEKH